MALRKPINAWLVEDWLQVLDKMSNTKKGQNVPIKDNGINQYDRVRQNGGGVHHGGNRKSSRQNGALKSISRDIGALKRALISIG